MYLEVRIFIQQPQRNYLWLSPATYAIQINGAGNKSDLCCKVNVFHISIIKKPILFLINLFH